MAQTTTTKSETNSRLPRTIVFAGLLVGTLDILAASIQTLIYGRSPLNMLKFVASGVFGSEALTGGPAFSFYGLFFHYCIAMGWTVLFFLVYPKLDFLSRNRILTGLGYGLFVWICMSQIVLPLSNTPSLPFKLSGAIIAVLILMAAIGLPLSFIANKYYSTRRRL
ncbi:MAG: hypothetical protein C0490_11150 [Marivirga sp.]|nr:hypothetical protein [Marivirga sp.]